MGRVERVERVETLADVLAEMRKIRVREFQDFADRIEAARKRELGNVAAMREALTKVSEWMAHRIATCGFEASATFPTMLEGVVLPALAAPPRNCDMPLVVDGPADNNADKAWLVFRRHNLDAYFDVSGLLRCIDWLFAPATEGGAA